jgi:predicted amidohydrolase YtcJ
LLPAVRRLGLTVVTQPAFVFARGDQYLRDVDEQDRPDLWRLRSLLDSGIPVAVSSDAPFGPWAPGVVIRAASTRKTFTGRSVGPGERVGGTTALSLYFGDPAEPGRRRAIAAGEPADLCLFSEPLRGGPDLPPVRATIVEGKVVYSAGS